MNTRWIAKRGLKWVVEWGTQLSGLGLLYRSTSYYKTGCRILNYHKVEATPSNSYSISVKDFRDHMAYLAKHVSLVRLDNLVSELKSGRLGIGRLAVTFDDGYSELAGYAGDILSEFNIPATIFIITGKTNAHDERGTSQHLSWSEIRRLHERGFEIGSHTVNHVSLRSLGQESMRQEILESANRIAQEIGQMPSGIAYPYGTMRDFSTDVAQICAEAGHLYGATAINGLNHAGTNPFVLRRTTISAGDGLRTLKLILKGCLDGWVLIDKWGYRLQRQYDD